MKKVQIFYQIMIGQTKEIEITDEEYNAMVQTANDNFSLDCYASDAYNLGNQVYENTDYNLRQTEEFYVRDSLMMLGWEC